MSIKTCSKCGWVYPITSERRYCKFCGYSLNIGICTVCKKHSDNLLHSRCAECRRQRDIEWRNNRIDEDKKTLTEWLDKIHDIPTPYTTLTEDQWLEACKHFGGCAYCGSPEIESRAMFITFKRGGRYCDWNIIPSCERCQTVLKTDDNPFRYMDSRLYCWKGSPLAKNGFSLENLQKIVDYLGSKIDKHIGEVKE